MRTDDRPTRPAPVTAVVVLGLLQGLLLLAAGVIIGVVVGANSDLAQDLDVGPTALWVAGAALAVVGGTGFVLSVMLARGSELARSAYGALNVLQVATAVYTLVAVREVAAGGLWSLLLAVAVLWCLYGSDSAAEYFER